MARKQDVSKAAGAVLALVLAAAAGGVALLYIGARNMVRGYERGVAATIFITIFCNLALISMGLVLAILSLPIILSIFDSNPSTGNTEPSHVGAAFGLSIVSAAAGFLSGAIQRSKRVEMFAVARDNAQFMARNGIRTSGRDDVTHYDANDNPLRYMETCGQQQVYMAVGRRNKRAYIDLDASGRMIHYSGIVSL